MNIWSYNSDLGINYIFYLDFITGRLYQYGKTEKIKYCDIKFQLLKHAKQVILLFTGFYFKLVKSSSGLNNLKWTLNSSSSLAYGSKWTIAFCTFNFKHFSVMLLIKPSRALMSRDAALYLGLKTLFLFIYFFHSSLFTDFLSNYKISREKKLEPEPGFEPRTSGFLARR